MLNRQQVPIDSSLFTYKLGCFPFRYFSLFRDKNESIDVVTSISSIRFSEYAPMEPRELWQHLQEVPGYFSFDSGISFYILELHGFLKMYPKTFVLF